MIEFEPVYKPALWGGRRLEEEFGRQLPPGTIGESWELGELPEYHSTVPKGEHAAKSLGELWRSGALGGSARGNFPFLLKWIDAQQNLSVQVHPDEATCARLGRGQPKTEAWYVVHVEPKSCLLIGHYPGLDNAALRQAAAGGTLQKWLYETRPRTGDIFLLEAGTVHAIGAGFLLLEVQQPSDTTYRIYDWGRVGPDGMPRTLHLDDACEAIRYDRYGAPRAHRQGVKGPCFALHSLPTGVRLPAQGLRVFVADSGPMRLATERGEHVVDFGGVVVAEPADGIVQIAAGTAVLLTEPQ